MEIAHPPTIATIGDKATLMYQALLKEPGVRLTRAPIPDTDLKAILFVAVGDAEDIDRLYDVISKAADEACEMSGEPVE